MRSPLSSSSGTGSNLVPESFSAAGPRPPLPVDIVKDISAQIKEKGKVERGWLGVGIGQNEKGQTQIGAIDPDSPAELAKLQEGDIVLKIGDRDVSSPEVLAAEIRKKKPGQDVTLKIDRDGKPLNVKVKLGEMAENEAFREMDIRFPGFFGPDAPMPGPAPRAVSPDKAPRPDSPRPLVPMTPEWSYETRKYIGVYCGELNRELAEHFGVKDGTGLIVSKLTEGGPAEKAKLKVGDVITKVDGKRVESANDLIDLVQAKEKGAKIKLEILRDKKAMTIDVEVSEEESSGLFDSGDFQGFLESWQGYTDAFKNELKKWQSEGMPEIRQNLKKISPKALLKRI
jgi:serine protease Do